MVKEAPKETPYLKYVNMVLRHHITEPSDSAPIYDR